MTGKRRMKSIQALGSRQKNRRVSCLLINDELTEQMDTHLSDNSSAPCSSSLKFHQQSISGESSNEEYLIQAKNTATGECDGNDCEVGDHEGGTKYQDGNNNSGKDNSGDDNCGDDNSVDDNSVDDNSGDDSSGNNNRDNNSGYDSDNPISTNSGNNCSCSFHLESKLRNWVSNEKNISSKSVTRLLRSLHGTFPSLPKTAHTLKQETKHPVIEIGGGEYAHLDWIDALKGVIENEFTVGPKIINLLVNIDGLPLYRNTSKYTTYPILVSPLQFPKYVLTVGVYCSNKLKLKGMPPVPDLLEQFINDLKSLRGKLVTSKGTFTVEVGPFICDSPVRSELKNVVGHSGYNSCERCVQHGTYCHGHVILSKTDCPKRTDENFHKREHPSHHKDCELSALEAIGFPMVTGFVLDYMHLVCIGVMKRLMSRWKSSRNTQKRNISAQLLKRNLMNTYSQLGSTSLQTSIGSVRVVYQI